MPADLQPLFLIVRDLLATARGRKLAWTLDRLAEAAGTSRRDVEQVLEERLSDFPFPLVSGSPGYWIPEDAEEINHYRASLRSRAVKIFIRAKRVAVMARRAGWPQEGRLFRNPPARQGELNL